MKPDQPAKPDTEPRLVTRTVGGRQKIVRPRARSTARDTRLKPSPAQAAQPRAASPGLETIEQWFADNGWAPFPFQRAAWAAYARGESGLIQVPTGSGKTYAALMGPLADLIDHPPAAGDGLCVIYLSPLRAVTRDIEAAIRRPIDELGLPLTVGSRTGDTGAAERARQKSRLPNILCTTPESLTLMMSYPDCAERIGRVRAVLLDEWHELLSSKRGSQTELALARIRRFSPQARTWALSATIANIDEAARIAVGVGTNPTIVGRGADAEQDAALAREVVLTTVLPVHVADLPWAGHFGQAMLEDVAASLDPAHSTLLFTNTRAQAEVWFQGLLATRPAWADAMALHHGSLDREERERIEAGLKAGTVRICVATSSLDLGVDFSPVERVYQIGSPKGVARLLQRAGRASHRPGAACHVTCVPTHGFELIEFSAAREAVARGEVEPREPLAHPLDVLAQHLVTCALGGGFSGPELLAEVRTATGFAALTDAEWAWTLELVTAGGKALGAYDEFRKVSYDGRRYSVPVARTAQLHRINIGTIAVDPTVSLMLGAQRIGQVEEYFIGRLKPGDGFIFAGRPLKLVKLSGTTATVKPATKTTGVTPHWAGSRMPLSTCMSHAVRRTLARLRKALDVGTGEALDAALTDPELVAAQPLITAQAALSALPLESELLIETWSSGEGEHLFLYPFAGRGVHEGLAALLATRFTRAEPATLQLTVNDYGLEILAPTGYPLRARLGERLEALSTDSLLEDIAQSLNMSELARRQFREVARVAGLVMTGFPGPEKTARALQTSTSLLFDVLTRYDPENLLVYQARREVLEKQFDQTRLGQVLNGLSAAKPLWVSLSRPSPMGFPLMADRLGLSFAGESLEGRLAALRAMADTGKAKSAPLRRGPARRETR